jgi:hypothetical protein
MSTVHDFRSFRDTSAGGDSRHLLCSGHLTGLSLDNKPQVKAQPSRCGDGMKPTSAGPRSGAGRRQCPLESRTQPATAGAFATRGLGRCLPPARRKADGPANSRALPGCLCPGATCAARTTPLRVADRPFVQDLWRSCGEHVEIGPWEPATGSTSLIPGRRRAPGCPSSAPRRPRPLQPSPRRQRSPRPTDAACGHRRCPDGPRRSAARRSASGGGIAG